MNLKLSFCFMLLLFVCVNGMVSADELSSRCYASTCPAALFTIKAAVVAAVLKEPRTGASLLRPRMRCIGIAGRHTEFHR
ncbi:hypothetical protein K1719_043124 [Acacia pycnantha]|nr:hypothetical protein K1719_043124 [Acacia pycnantha]